MSIDDIKAMIADMLRVGYSLTVEQACPDLVQIGITNKDGKWRGTNLSMDELANSSNAKAKIRENMERVVASLGGTLKREKEG